MKMSEERPRCAVGLSWRLAALVCGCRSGLRTGAQRRWGCGYVLQRQDLEPLDFAFVLSASRRRLRRGMPFFAAGKNSLADRAVKY